MNIISRTPRLARLYSADLPADNFAYSPCETMLTWDIFCVLAKTAGSSLLEFDGVGIYKTGLIYAPYPFASFTVLRSFLWNCPAVFDVREGTGLGECFPHLESLTVMACDPSFLELTVEIE
jgi:hypothetical protein